MLEKVVFQEESMTEILGPHAPVVLGAPPGALNPHLEARLIMQGSGSSATLGRGSLGLTLQKRSGQREADRRLFAQI